MSNMYHVEFDEMKAIDTMTYRGLFQIHMNRLRYLDDGRHITLEERQHRRELNFRFFLHSLCYGDENMDYDEVFDWGYTIQPQTVLSNITNSLTLKKQENQFEIERRFFLMIDTPPPPTTRKRRLVPEEPNDAVDVFNQIRIENLPKHKMLKIRRLKKQAKRMREMIMSYANPAFNSVYDFLRPNSDDDM